MARIDTQQGMELSTILDFVRWTFSTLNQSDIYYGHGTDNAWDEAFALVLGCLSLPPDTDTQLFQANLTSIEKETLCSALDKRINQRLPLAYITNTTQFAGIDFYIDDRALIPRSPIAELIENNFSPWFIEPPKNILDLCTGGGCIALACAMYNPDACVDGVDISSDALAVAQLNNERLGLTEQVTFHQSDLYQAVTGNRYDLILTNPPYVDQEDMDNLPTEYRHEPELALASGADGLDCAREIISHAAEHLTDDGVLILEVGNSAPALEEAYPGLEFMWLEFERGGAGVCMLQREQLLKLSN